MTDRPPRETRGVLTIDIKTNNKPIPDDILVTSIKTSSEIDGLPEAVIRFEHDKFPEEPFKAANDVFFEEGRTISIAAGLSDLARPTLFEGVITGKSLRVRDGRLILDVTARHAAIALTAPLRTRAFQSKTATDAMSEILNENGFSLEIDTDSEETTDQILVGRSDWDSLRYLARQNGLILTTKGKSLRAARPAFDARPDLSLTLGEDIIAFDATSDATKMLTSAETSAWDPEEQEMHAEASTRVPNTDWGDMSPQRLARVFPGRADVHSSSAPRTPEHLSQTSDARMLCRSLAALQGSVTARGTAAATPGGTIGLRGLGDRFDGVAFVSGVSHTIEKGEWLTTVRLGLDLSEPAAPLAEHSFDGLHIGKVVNLGPDPANLDRIQILLPAANTTLWARFAQPYATKSAGLQFLPELDDEVVLAFLDDDPSGPVVLGSLHNPTAPRAQPFDGSNDIKTLTSREKLTVQFDDGRKALTLNTPGGNSVILDDTNQSVTLADQTGNSVVMNADGITIVSEGDLTLSASGDIRIDADKDATLHGLNTALTADGQLSANGGSGASFTASGTVTVQGALVNIN